MDRSIIFILLGIIAASDACRPPPCHWVDPKPILDYFDDVSQKLAMADVKQQSYCNQHGCPNVKEMNLPNVYQIKIPSAGAESFDIKVSARVLMVRGQNCVGPVADVRILPTYVNGRSGSYTMDGEDLVITFRYKFIPESGGGSCLPPDGTVITLPRKDAIKS